ncbi:MAG: class I SAM-dependent methyltransferase [Calditrichaeota bacterium]|nr:MAG: class I SAM-dependent methyltransferase [Calditrichota bacterium]
MKHNKATYNSTNIVQHYSRKTYLQPPEKTILNLLKPHLPEMKMLDAGVGGGRTTPFFASEVKEYIGFDYAKEMIMECKKRFSNSPDNVKFEVCDVRDMSIFEDNTFDFILFSFNGLDVISHEDRLKAFQEIKRVGKKGGYFCFSTHNLNNIHRLFEFKHQFALHPKRTIKNFKRWYKLNYIYNNAINMAKLQDSTYTIFKDGALDFRLDIYYIKAEEQIKQLQEYFKDIRVFSYKSGQEVQEEHELKNIDDPWLYYLCVIR